MTTNTQPTPETNRELINRMDMKINSIIDGLAELKIKMDLYIDMLKTAQKIKAELDKK